MLKRNELSSSFWIIVSKVLILLINLVAFASIARELGVESFGELSYILAFINLVMPLSAMGLNSLVTKEILDNPEREAEIMSSALMVRLAGSFLGFVILIFLYKLNINEASPAIVFSAVSAIGSSFLVADFWFEAKLKNRIPSIWKATVVIVFSSLKIFAAVNYQAMELILLVFTIEYIVNGLGSYYLFMRTSKFKFKLPSLSISKELITKGKWLFMSGLAAIIYLKIDTIMLGILSSNNQVGIYSLAARLSEVWYFIPMAFVTSSFPRLVNLKGSSSYHDMIQKSCDYLFILGCIASVSAFFLADYFINLVFGPEFEQSALVLKIHIIGGIFMSLRFFLSKWLINENLLQASLYTQVFGALSNVILNLYLIDKYGAVGAAVATVISYLIASHIVLFFMKPTREIAFVFLKSYIFPYRFIVKKLGIVNEKII